MKIDVMPIAEVEKPVLWGELQNYIAELAGYDPNIEPVDGAYDYPLEVYWCQPNHWAFWSKVDGQIAGFGLVHRRDGVTDMAEFYVKPAYRRTGVGITFARELIARFKGPWVLSEYQSNTGAIAFWRRAIEGYAFVERSYVSKNGNPRLEQRFII